MKTYLERKASEPNYLEIRRQSAKKRYYRMRVFLLQQMREVAQLQRLELMNLLGGAFCKRCDFNDVRALQFDHINGGGTQERTALGGQQKKVWQRIRMNPAAYQVLCANCNWIKRKENEEDFTRFRRSKTPDKDKL